MVRPFQPVRKFDWAVINRNRKPVKRAPKTEPDAQQIPRKIQWPLVYGKKLLCGKVAPRAVVSNGPGLLLQAVDSESQEQSAEACPQVEWQLVTQSHKSGKWIDVKLRCTARATDDRKPIEAVCVQYDIWLERRRGETYYRTKHGPFVCSLAGGGFTAVHRVEGPQVLRLFRRKCPLRLKFRARYYDAHDERVQQEVDKFLTSDLREEPDACADDDGQRLGDVEGDPQHDDTADTADGGRKSTVW